MNVKRQHMKRQASEASVQNTIETVLSHVEHPRTTLLHDAYIEYHFLMKCKLLIQKNCPTLLKEFTNTISLQDKTRYKCRPLYRILESAKDDTNGLNWAWTEYTSLLAFQEAYQKYETKESQSFSDEKITPVLEILSSTEQYDIKLANIELTQLLKTEDRLKQMFPDDYKAYKATSEDLNRQQTLRQYNTDLERALLKAVTRGIGASEVMGRYLYLKMYERNYEDLQKEQHKINRAGAIKTSSARPGGTTQAKHEPPPDYPGTVKDGDFGEYSGETISSKSSEEKETMPDTIDITKNEKYQTLLHEISLKEVKIEELKNRLSNVAGNKLTDGNPNIADLSDENRPTKIGEMFGSLYDDEWTDVFESMKDSRTTEEDAIIRGLQLIVKRSFEVCQSTAKSQIQRLQHASEKIMLDPLGERPKDTTKKTKISDEKKQISSDEQKQILLLGVKHLKDYRKTTASASTTELCEYFRSSVMTEITEDLKWKNKNIPEHVLKYAYRCVKITWLMSVQDPPMYLHWAKEKDVVNSDIFKCYEKMGKNVEFTVWPALSLYEGGPLISKGFVKAK